MDTRLNQPLPSPERFGGSAQHERTPRPLSPFAHQVRRGQTGQTGQERAVVKIAVTGVNVFYGATQVLFGISLPLYERQTTALIGPSGCGKSTFLRTLNRMNDLIPQARSEGEALMDDLDIFDDTTDVVGLRQRVGMVFQRPNPYF